MVDEIEMLDSKRMQSIRERIARLERAERDPFVVDWTGAYYGDVYFLLGFIARHFREQHDDEQP